MTFVTLSLTDMWKAARSPDGRGPSDWQSLPETGRFVEFLTDTLNAGKSGNDLFHAVRGGRSPGTWAHWQIGLAYAKYLSPASSGFCAPQIRGAQILFAITTPTFARQTRRANEVTVFVEGVLLGRATSGRVFTNFGKNHEVAVFIECVLTDAVRDPVAELLADAEGGMQVPGVHGLDERAADGAFAPQNWGAMTFQ